MPLKTFAHGGAICLAMDRPSDDGGIIVERTDDRVLVQKRQVLLRVGLPLGELTDCPQAIRTVRQGYFAGSFQGFAGMPLGESQ